MPNHPWPRTEKKQKTIAAIDLFPCGFWESHQEPGRQLSRVSCGPTVATPNVKRTMHCAETPVGKDQKLQPSISCLWSLAPQRWAGNMASTQPGVHSCLGNANTGSFRTNEACNTCNTSRSRKADIHRRVHHEAHFAHIDHMSNRRLVGNGPVNAHWGRLAFTACLAQSTQGSSLLAFAACLAQSIQGSSLLAFTACLAQSTQGSSLLAFNLSCSKHRQVSRVLWPVSGNTCVEKCK